MLRGSRKDYQKKTFRNPFLSRAEQSKKPRRLRWNKAAVLGGFIFFIIGLKLISGAEVFQIKKVEVIGNKRLSVSEIEQVVLKQLDERKYWLFEQSSILFFDKSQAKKILEENFLFESLKIKKKYFNKIIVEVEERQSGVAWISGASQHFLDLEGIALRAIDFSGDVTIENTGNGTDVIRSEISSGRFPVIYDQSNSEVSIGQLVASSDPVNFVIILSKEFEVTADFEISHFNVERPFSREVSLVTKEGWEAKFKIDDEPIGQARLLSSVVDQKVSDRKGLEYIDLRFGEKIFYK